MQENESFATDLIHNVFLADRDDQWELYSGAKMSLIELLFFRAITTRSDIANMQDKDDFNVMLDFMRMCAPGAGGFDEASSAKVLDMIEKNYNLPKGSLENKFKLFKGHWGLLSDNFNNNFSVPTDIDYAPTIKDLISRPQSSKDSANTYQYYTNESLQKMVAGILNVKKNETFMDCCCGMFSSALYNDAAEYIGVELNKEIAGIAAMNLIMCKKKFNIKLGNFAEFDEKNVADKILADIPGGAAMPKMENRPYGKNVEAYCIENVVNALKDGGSAVVICFGSILGKQDSSKKLREAITRDHLKAVVALPPMNIGTRVNTNLILLEKNCHAKEIKFINASGLEIENQNRMTLSQSDISDIIGCLEGKESNCLSKDIPVEDILNSSNISWSPNQYVKGGVSTAGRSVEEIDEELEASYKELKQLLLD